MNVNYRKQVLIAFYITKERSQTETDFHDLARGYMSSCGNLQIAKRSGSRWFKWAWDVRIVCGLYRHWRGCRDISLKVLH